MPLFGGAGKQYQGSPPKFDEPMEKEGQSKNVGVKTISHVHFFLQQTIGRQLESYELHMQDAKQELELADLSRGVNENAK
jgi:hypothetical protein